MGTRDWIVIGVVLAVFAPALAPYDPAERVGVPFQTPGAAHLLGTNDVGQDILSELIFGTRVSLLVGIVAATLMRIAFASLAIQLLQIVGLLLAGGILLLWVCWKMWRELRHTAVEDLNAEATLADRDLNADGTIGRAPRSSKTFRQATTQIIIADFSMSLDNVLAVAGAAREHPVVLIFGLALSIALMAVAATLIARLLGRHRWIAYVGLLIILYVAVEMIWRGTAETWPVINGAIQN